jgi:hypothetical protein
MKSKPDIKQFVSVESLNAFVDSNTINPEDYRVAPAEEEDQGSRDQGPGFRVSGGRWKLNSKTASLFTLKNLRT